VAGAHRPGGRSGGPAMSTLDELSQLADREYAYGFVTDLAREA
jgi:hypothetical protein